ncbi:MAG: methyltransferase domain-containing protein [Candidatus Hodarchaeales archaeon]|jgi:SAM-dependent methyltransferase
MEAKTTEDEVSDIGNYFTDISHVFEEEYDKKGLKKHTKFVIDFFNNKDLSNDLVLELGCGVGGLLLKFLELGAKHAYGIDLSEAMIESAKKNAKGKKFDEKTNFYVGDFNSLSKGILPVNGVDIVVADRVLCCSPVPLEILQSMIDFNPKNIVIVQPRKNLVTRLFMWIRKKTLRFRLGVKQHKVKTPYVSIKEYDNLCKTNFYNKVSQNFRWGWEIVIYEKLITN